MSAGPERNELSARIVLGDAVTGKSAIVKSIIRTGKGEKPKSNVNKQESIFTHTLVSGGNGKNKTRFTSRSGNTPSNSLKRVRDHSPQRSFLYHHV